MDPALALPLELPSPGSRMRLRSLHEQLRTAILDGRLRPGLRLPPTRTLADAYGVSRNTAVAAYDLLLSEGYVVSRPRSGAYVADIVPHSRHRSPAKSDAASDRRLNPFWREPPELVPAARLPRVRFDFRLGIADKDHFPFEIWRRLSARSLRTFAGQPAAYGSPRGRPALREAIAKHVSFARAVACGSDDIVVTAGSQQAFDLLARILVVPGHTIVAVENPGYTAIRTVFAAAGARIAAVPVDAEGLIVDRIPSEAQVICVTPSHQFPLGTTMSMRRRVALLEFAQARRAAIVEDDYDGEFRYGDRALDTLQTLDREDCVFYVGTFTKSVFPGIRLGFAVVPRWAQRALVAAKLSADVHCAVLDQDTLAAFISEGHMARHVRRMRRIYAARLEFLLSRLRGDFGHWLDPVPSSAGLHVTAFAATSLDIEALVARAREHEVGVYSLRPYYLEGPAKPGIVFGYGDIDETGMLEGLARLRRIWPATM